MRSWLAEHLLYYQIKRRAKREIRLLPSFHFQNIDKTWCPYAFVKIFAPQSDNDVAE